MSSKVMEETERVKTKEEEEIWSWGAGTEGQLGTGKLQDEHHPQLIQYSLSSFCPISHLSCGGAHVIALTSGGRVLTWGRGTSGQLGHGEMVNCLHPKSLESLEGIFITHASAGWNHSGFVSDTGYVFTCGDGSFGQLGHGDYISRCSPEQLFHFKTRHVQQVACGMRHSLVLLKGDTEDLIYGFGSGKRGQLGISDDKQKLVSTPQVTLGFENVKIKSVTANGDHSAAISGDGEVYILGRYNYNVPTGAQNANMMKHISEEEGVMQRVLDFDSTKVGQIGAGAEHSAVVTADNGSVMTWGWGEHGQLGLGDTNDQTGPQVVSLIDEQSRKPCVGRVYCGSGFTFVVRTHTVNSSF